MIKQKDKICKGCESMTRIFAHGFCTSCYKKNNPIQIKKTPIKSSSKPIAKRSKREEERLKKYYVLREQYLKEHPTCEVCKIAPATEIHHKKKRISENLYLHFLAVDRSCHSRIENNPEWAIEMGYSINHLQKN